MERETVKIKSNNPAHPKGYYIQFRDMMKPEDEEYVEEKEKPPIQEKQPRRNKK